ncbi:MAG: metallophosphoesterase [Prochloraceae cyanobacterium]|nr:metallophosphoesterase [Prochloraceae cyanobacterium]
MNINRRHFLMGLAALGGLGGIFTHQYLAQSSSLKTPIEEKKSTSSQKVVTDNSVSETSQIPPNVRIVLISDLNSQYGSTSYEPEVHQAIALIPELKPDLILCAGDSIAGQKLSLTNSQIKAMWAAFDRDIGEKIRDLGIPYGFTIGNHDGSGGIVKGNLVFKRERKLASEYWNDPQHTPKLNFIDRAQFPFYYSFKEKDIFFLVWDASTNLISQQQLTWAEKSLASDAAQKAKMRVVLGHLPLYAVAVGRNKPGAYLHNATSLQMLLERYGVHTYISGHHHAYYPGKKGQLQLLHAGALGGGPRKLLNSNLPPRKTLTLLDIDLSSTTTVYTTYNMKTKEVISDRSLPQVIVSPNGKIYRRDLT